MIKIIKLVFFFFCLVFAVSAESILFEAEMFETRGGWVVDPQFMDQMGSPYLLAHGLGKPVADAETKVMFSTSGNYRVWVRTMDWVARWQASGSPGKFQLLVNNTPLPVTFGTEGAQWHWHDGGLLSVKKGEISLQLHDLTGFEGRCDAILFSTDLKMQPPSEKAELNRLRRKLLGIAEQPQSVGTFDLVVVGGGTAGTCAALSAARLGLKVALVQDRPVLGGNNSSEVRVWLHGARNLEPWPHVGDIVAELEQAARAHYGPANTAELYEDERKLALAMAEPNLKLFLEHRANNVIRDQNRITAVIAQDINSGGRLRLNARYVADCSGDGCVGFLAGADFDMTPKGRMGPCNLWHVRPTSIPQSFPRCPWALDLTDKPFPGRSKTKPQPDRLGGWYWESGFDIDPFEDIEAVRDWNFRAMYGAWDAIKNVDGQLSDYELGWSAYIMGKRESRRLMGDVILSKEDVLSNRSWDDACVPTGWKFDLHLPDPKYENGFEGNAFISRAHFTSYQGPYWVPYRILYSRNIENLFMAGRDVSVTHDALGTVRVMRTGGCMGEVVGMAASVAVKHNVTNRDVYTKHLSELKMLMSVGVGRLSPDAIKPDYGLGISSRAPKKAISVKPPDWLSKAGTNLCLSAEVDAEGVGAVELKGIERINDGKADIFQNEQRWISPKKMPLVIEFKWKKPQKFTTLRISSGYAQGTSVIAPVNAWTLAVWNGDAWVEVPAAQVRDNTDPQRYVHFPVQSTQRIQLRIESSKDDIARLWEVELYQCN
ncbi:MAG: FAD-dependent oxidoreductase [Kiritimatiellae bacterium]|nr:FAD-dependent oxidoreductase [Kiritimatiellia bacterium]